MSERELWSSYQAAVICWQASPSRSSGERMAHAFEAWSSVFLENPVTAKAQADVMRAELARSVAWVRSA